MATRKNQLETLKWIGKLKYTSYMKDAQDDQKPQMHNEIEAAKRCAH